jgi:NADH-quinone oxidoreductase subunit M
MPVYAALFGITVMSSAGLPLLNGFVGEFLILLGAFRAAPGVTAAATFGVVLSAVYLLWMYRRVFFGPLENPENRGLIDLGLREQAVMVAMIVPMFWIGVYPDTLLRRLHPPVLDLLQVMEAKTKGLRGLAAESAHAQLLAAIESGGDSR